MYNKTPTLTVKSPLSDADTYSQKTDNVILSNKYNNKSGVSDFARRQSMRMDTGVMNDLEDLIKNEQNEMTSGKVPQSKAKEDMPDTDMVGLLLRGRTGNYLK